MRVSERVRTHFVERRNTQQSWFLSELKLLISLSLSMLLVLPSSPECQQYQKNIILVMSIKGLPCTKIEVSLTLTDLQYMYVAI